MHVSPLLSPLLLPPPFLHRIVSRKKSMLLRGCRSVLLASGQVSTSLLPLEMCMWMMKCREWRIYTIGWNKIKLLFCCLENVPLVDLSATPYLPTLYLAAASSLAEILMCLQPCYLHFWCQKQFSIWVRILHQTVYSCIVMGFQAPLCTPFFLLPMQKLQRCWHPCW